MSAAHIEAEGLDGTVTLSEDNLLVKRRVLGGMLRQAAALYREGPGAVAAALEGPSREVLLQALSEDRELVKVLLDAVRADASDADYQNIGAKAGEPVDPSRSPRAALAEALRTKRHALVRALRENDDLVKQWIKNHKDFAGIFLKGDVHAYKQDVQANDLVPCQQHEGSLTLTINDSRVKVRFSAPQEPMFLELHRALSVESRPQKEVSALNPVTKTKICPMCAEEVKIAAKVCRFCTHRFDLDAPALGSPSEDW